jgi:hypothetical protein
MADRRCCKSKSPLRQTFQSQRETRPSGIRLTGLTVGEFHGTSAMQFYDDFWRAKNHGLAHTQDRISGIWLAFI